MKIFFVLLLMALAGCSGPGHKRDGLPVPSSSTNRVSIDQFRAVPVPARPLLPDRFLARALEMPIERRFSAGGWELRPVAVTNLMGLMTVKEVPVVSINGLIWWTARPGYYRTVISDDGLSWWESSFTCQWRETNIVTTPVPTNKYYKLVSP